MVCVQYLLAGIDIDPESNYFAIGEGIAPGGYDWVFPKGERKANVGLGVQAVLWKPVVTEKSSEKEIAVRGNAVLGYLNRFIEAHPRLERGHPATAGNVSVAPTPSRLAIDGLMVVGDAARQVDPLTGGRIINAMTEGKLAASVAVEAIAVGDTSAAFLSRYEEKWSQSIRCKNQRDYRFRVRFGPSQRIDDRFVRAFALAASS